MNYFRSDDRFRIKETELTGTIVCVWYNYQKNDYELIVKWDHSMSSTYSYLESDVRGMWEKIDQLPTGIIGGCQSNHHDWSTYVGFTDTFEFCKKCDEKRVKC